MDVVFDDKIQVTPPQKNFCGGGVPGFYANFLRELVSEFGGAFDFYGCCSIRALP